MNFEKLLDFLSENQRKIAVSCIVSSPIFYATLFLYVPLFRELIIFDKCVLAIATSIVFVSICCASLYFVVDKKMKSSLIYAIILLSGMPVLGGCIVHPFGGEFSLRMLVFLYLFIVFAFIIITHNTSSNKTKSNVAVPTEEDNSADQS